MFSNAPFMIMGALISATIQDPGVQYFFDQKTAAVLGHNYPGSEWYKDVYRLMSARGHPLAKAPEKKGPLGHIFGGG